MKSLFIFFIASILVLPTVALALQGQPVAAGTPANELPKNQDLSLAGQYQFVLSRSKTINGFKLINPYRMGGVWKSVTDTLRKERSAHKNALSKIAEQEQKITQLQSEVASSRADGEAREARQDEISVLGMSVNKGVYNITVWSLIALLAAALSVVVYRFVSYVRETKNKQDLYGELSAEFQAFKAKSSEKERKLARELQDERNTVEELKQEKKR